MPLFYQKFIMRAHLQANRNVLFIFGDNVQRYGKKGQAAEMRGEPNAIGVATKWKPSSTPDSYFSDDHFDEIIPILRNDLTPVHSALMAQKIVVWPRDGIGAGLSQLPKRAPKIWAELEKARLFFETL